jgi:hypothetical protein
VTSTEDGTLNWGVANRSFGDVDIRVNVTQVHAPSNNNNGFGVACRLVDGKDGYFLMISGDGLYAIIKFVGGSPAYLVNWTTASTIRQGNASNQLRAVCQGSQFSLYVNGGRLASVTDDDPDFASGDIGFAVTTLEDTPTEVHFDSLTVTSP